MPSTRTRRTRRTRGPLLLSPASPAGYAEMLLRARIDHARGLADRGERGASVVEWVIISALVVGIAVAVGAILLTRLRNKAESIDLDTRPVAAAGRAAGAASPDRSGRSGRSIGERGASTIELAMYLPILFFVIFAVVQASLLYLGNQAASAAAREAARVARSGGGSAQAMDDGVARGREYAVTVGHGVLEHVTVVVGPAGDGQVRAVVTGHGVQVVPGLPTPGIRQVSQGPVELFRPDL